LIYLIIKVIKTMIVFNIAKLHEDAVIPTRGSAGAAGYDLSSCDEGIVRPRSWKMFNTGIAIEISSDCYARVAPRSGLTLKKGITTGAGVIDSDYRNTIGVVLFNHSDEEFIVSKGDRIAQLILERIYTPEIDVIEYSSMMDTERGLNGFGSTGV
jgi:dUTP pyrophosphatase